MSNMPAGQVVSWLGIEENLGESRWDSRWGDMWLSLKNRDMYQKSSVPSALLLWNVIVLLSKTLLKSDAPKRGIDILK